ncbi:hypothetical protein KEM60_01303 [Austwickia sp. TVS 96-490-7B]|nr:hypothetical protein [Austwickia sp. TVS 96-490-7B]
MGGVFFAPSRPWAGLVGCVLGFRVRKVAHGRVFYARSRPWAGLVGCAVVRGEV